MKTCQKIMLLLSLTTINCFAVTKKMNDHVFFQTLFTQWTEAFNHQHAKKTCDLFSKKVIATYGNLPQKNYAMICSGFHKIFKNKSKQYRYQFKIHEIYQSHFLTAVRITWYLNIYQGGKLIESSTDEGLDILEKEGTQWRIVNYLAYPID